jgi:hypothetical protein
MDRCLANGMQFETVKLPASVHPDEVVQLIGRRKAALVARGLAAAAKKK